MAVNINEGGFLYLSDGSNTMQVPFETAKVKIQDDVTRERFPGDAGLKFSLGIISRDVQITNVYFSSHDNAKNFIKQLVDWNQAGEFTLKLYRNSSDDEAEVFGNGSTSLDVLFADMSGIEKHAKGDQQKYKIARVVFVE